MMIFFNHPYLTPQRPFIPVVLMLPGVKAPMIDGFWRLVSPVMGLLFGNPRRLPRRLVRAYGMTWREDTYLNLKPLKVFFQDDQGNHTHMSKEEQYNTSPKIRSFIIQETPVLLVLQSTVCACLKIQTPNP